MKLHLPVRLRASLIAAVIAVASGVYNAYANDITGTNIPFSEVYNHTSGNTYTATNNITFQATQQTQGVFASFISGDTTLTAGNAVVFANHFGANTTDLVPSQEKKYDGKLNIVTDKIQVAEGGNRVVLEDVKVSKKTAATGEVSVGALSELVVLNGDISTLSDAEKKTLHAEGLVNTPTCEQRPSSQQTVVMGALTGTGNFAVYGDENDTDAVRVAAIGTSGTTFGNVSAANESLNITGAVNANTLVAVRSDVNAGQAVTLIGLDLDVDSALTAAGDIDAGDTTGHVAVYGAVESTGGNVHLIHGNKSDKDGLHEGSSVKAAQKAIIEDLNAVLAEVEGTHGVEILNGSVVESSTITSGSETVDADIVVSKSTLKAHESTDTVLNSTQDITITNASNVTGTEMNADRSVIVSGGADVSDSDITAASEIVVTGTGTTMHGAVDLHDAETVRVQDGANFAIDGGSVDAGTLAIESAKGGSASVTDSTVALDTSKITVGQTLVYDGSTGNIGSVVENGEGSATLHVTGEADLTAGTVSSNDAHDSYFGKVQVDGAAELDVTGNAKITNYVAADDDTKVTFEESVSIKNAHISDSGEETIAKKDAHIGNLNLADGGVLTIDNTDAKNQSYIANITSGADGTLNVVNGTVDTPVLNHEDLVLGLNGGTVVLKTVTAEQGATVASTSPVNPHVSLDSITNAGVETPIGDSTIRTSLNRYFYDSGSENSADIYTYYYVARVDGKLDDGTVVTAGQLVTRTDEVFTKTLLTGEVVNSGVDLTSAATLSEHDALILDRLTQPMLDEYGEFIYGTPETLLTGQVRTLDYTATYYDGVDDWLSEETDGIASLTLQGDFGSDQTTINAYRVANWNAVSEVWVEDTTSGFINVGGDLTGNNNELYADTYIETGVVSGDSNTLGAHNSYLKGDGDIYIEAAGVTGDGNSLIADDYVTIGYIGGEDAPASHNTVAADTVTVTGDMVGSNNSLSAYDGSVTVGNVTGDENIMEASTNIETGDITGDSNKLTASQDIKTGDITGNSNALTAGGSISAGVVTGDENTLDAQDSVTAAGVDGNRNLLTSAAASVEVTGDVQGDTNKLLAEQNVSVDGSLKGNGNQLYSNTGYIYVGQDIEGNGNSLAAEDVVHVEGKLDGDANSLTSFNGDYVYVGGTVSGEGNELSALRGDVNIGGIDGTDTIATAQKTAWVGSLSGTGTELTVYANGLSKDDTAIIIDEFNAQDTTVTIATTTSEVYGETCGNGSIYIGALTATDGTVDPSMGNLVVSNNSYVEIGAMDGADAYTDIVARDYIAIGDEEGEQADTASHLTLGASALYVDSAEGVKLTDSKITVSGNIEGTSLTLTTTENGKSISSAASVSLENLTLGGNAMLTAAEAIISDTLTIDGKLATLDVTKVDTSTLVLRHNADISAARVGAENLVVEESTFAFTSIDGIQSFKIDASKGSVKQALDQLTGDVEVVNDSELYMNSDLATTAAVTVVDSALEAASITAGTSLTAENASVKSRKAITAADITADGSTVEASSIAATNELSVKNASTVQSGGAVTAAEISVADSTMSADSIAAANGLTIQNAEVEANKAITAKDITADGSMVDAGSIAATNVLSVKNASTVQSGGAVTAAEISVVDSSVDAESIAAENGLTAENAGLKAVKTITAKDITVGNSVVETAGIAATNGLTVKNASAVQSGGAITAAEISVADSDVDADSISATNGLTVQNAQVEANKAVAARDITVGQSTVGATDITADSTLTIENASQVTADNAITAAEISASDSTVAASGIAAGKKLAVHHAEVQVLNTIAAADVSVDESVVAATDITAGGTLSIGNASQVVAGGAVAAGEISVADSSLGAGSISAENGLDARSANVTAKKSIAIRGGESNIDNALVAAQTLALDGTVNAGEKTLLMGHITGDGSINKTGGDALVIADADSSVDINVQDASSLKLADGTKLGAVDMGTEAALLQLGENGHVDTVQMDSLTLSDSTDLTLDMDLNNGTMDLADAATAALNGVSIKLNAMGDESRIADQTRIAFVSGAVTTGALEDVEHGMQTLNAYADGNSIVLSKNYRSVDGLNRNQRNTAAALADLEDHTEVRGDMAEVMDALHHTRSAEETRAALDSLGGVGIAAVSKMATDDAHDHLQALRANYTALAAGVDDCYDNEDHRVPGVHSYAISASVTGGSTSVSSSNEAPKYSRHSVGALLSGVHAFTHDWLGGLSLGYSRSDGDCGTVNMKANSFYVDAALIRRTKYTTHTATLGFGHYGVDVNRQVAAGYGAHRYASRANGSTSASLVELSYEAVVNIARKEKHSFSGVFQTDLVFGQFSGMTESGAGSAGLRSEFDDVASINFGLGGRYTYGWGEATNPGYFAVEALFVGDAGDKKPVVKNTFIAGGQSFELHGPDAGACGLRLNAGVLAPIGKQWGAFGNLSTEFRAKQSSVSGSIGVKYAF
ncbi:MAG: hypothetical protein MJ058_08565 [Akkermansia sp.]|nr:hypothetical protein [Akkermansia sp.]